MKRFVTLFLLLLLAGCDDSHAEDVRSLARYQQLAPGTPIVLVINVEVSDYTGAAPDKSTITMDRKAEIVSVGKDTLSVIVELAGRKLNVNYAGSMIREIRVVAKEAEQAATAQRP